MKFKQTFTGLLLVIALLCQTAPVNSQHLPTAGGLVEHVPDQDISDVYKHLNHRYDDDVLPHLLEKLFGSDAPAALEAFRGGSEDLFIAVTDRANERTERALEAQITERKETKNSKPVIAPEPGRTRRKHATKRRAGAHGFIPVPQIDWQRLAFGFQSLTPYDSPEVNVTETEKKISAEGSQRKSFETKEAKGTRTQKVETTYVKDGKTFGVEIKDTQIIEAVSKPDGKSFRRELSLVWGADVAACPDVNGITSGTGKAKVISKTTYVEGGAAVTMTSEFDLQAKLTGHVNDLAKLTHYDLQVDAYATNSGYENALRQNIIKEIKIKDGRYGLHYDIPGNTIEISDGTYGGKRTPAKMGSANARLLTPMSDGDTTTIGKAVGPMIPTIWNSANEMYKSAERNWRNYGCVEVITKVAKTVIEPGEEITIASETVHLQDKSKITGELTAEAYEGVVTPEKQSARTTANFVFTQSGENASSFHVESVSKRGIGKGDVEFQLKKEESEATSGVWTGTINAKRYHREEREKRSGANLAENGGYQETSTDIQLRLTGQLDRSVDAANAHTADVSGTQQVIDLEYDRYKIDEGYCGPNAVPYKGPKEITRTSTTTAKYANQTRVFVEIGGTSGSLTFSLPEISGTTVHKYVHTSPCSEHDRANTNEAVDEDAAMAGGSFSVSFPVDPTQKTIKGSSTLRDENGGSTTFAWELARIGS